MLLHHAKKPDTVDDMVANNAHTVALSMCQDKNLLISERTVAAALIAAMANRTDLHDVLLRTKAASRQCAVALLDVALNTDNHVQLRLHSANALAKLTAQKENATLAMHNFQQVLPWTLLARLLSTPGVDMHLKGHLAMFLKNVLAKVSFTRRCWVVCVYALGWLLRCGVRGPTLLHDCGLGVDPN